MESALDMVVVMNEVRGMNERCESAVWREGKCWAKQHLLKYAVGPQSVPPPNKRISLADSRTPLGITQGGVWGENFWCTSPTGKKAHPTNRGCCSPPRLLVQGRFGNEPGQRVREGVVGRGHIVSVCCVAISNTCFRPIAAAPYLIRADSSSYETLLNRDIF